MEVRSLFFICVLSVKFNPNRFEKLGTETCIKSYIMETLDFITRIVLVSFDQARAKNNTITIVLEQREILKLKKANLSMNQLSAKS